MKLTMKCLFGAFVTAASPQEFWNIFFQEANGISNCQASMNFF
jgi:hypothetical protein